MQTQIRHKRTNLAVSLRVGIVHIKRAEQKATTGVLNVMSPELLKLLTVRDPTPCILVAKKAGSFYRLTIEWHMKKTVDLILTATGSSEQVNFFRNS